MAKVFIYSGQSNSQGLELYANLQAEYKTTFATIKAWNGTAFGSLDYTVENNQYPLQGLHSWGSQFSLLKKAQAYFGETIYLINYGYYRFKKYYCGH